MSRDHIIQYAAGIIIPLQMPLRANLRRLWLSEVRNFNLFAKVVVLSFGLKGFSCCFHFHSKLDAEKMYQKWGLYNKTVGLLYTKRHHLHTNR